MKKIKKSYLNANAFTLVELIVVIVILAILATIAFLSFSTQSSSARDSTRLSDMSNISKGLGVFSAIGGKLPMPDNKIDITASGAILGYQGYAGDTVLKMIKLSNGGKDPLDKTVAYTYTTNSNQSKFQLLGFLEDGNNSSLSLSPDFEGLSLKGVNADSDSFSGRYIITKGDQIGVLLNSSTLTPVQSANISIDLITTNSGTEYKAIFGNHNSLNNITSSGVVIFSSIVNSSPLLLQDYSLVIQDTSLVGFWDMVTLTGTLLRDFGKQKKHGTCYNSGDVVGCGGGSGGPTIIQGGTNNGKMLSFDGVDDYFKIPDPSLPQYNWSIEFMVSPNLKHRAVFIAPLSTGIDQFVHYSSGGQINMQLAVAGDTGERSFTTTQNNIPEGQFTHIVFQRDSATKKMYINGVLISSEPDTDVSGKLSDVWWIGQRCNFTYPLNGKMKNLKIYNRILSQVEISAHYTTSNNN